MTSKIVIYSRKNCCLCEQMKAAVREVGNRISLLLDEIDVDTSPELQAEYGDEVPVLFINGRKAFKYRVSAKELERRLRKESSVQ
jgi:glutaredoxin